MGDKPFTVAVGLVNGFMFITGGVVQSLTVVIGV
jgi:hypothetical protein